MGDMQTSRPLARVGRTFFGAVFGAALTVLAATVIVTANDTSGGWALGLSVLFYGAPIAMLLGAVTGALWPSNARVTIAHVVDQGQTRRLRDAPLAAWVMGVLGGIAAFVAYGIVAEGLLLLLGVFIRMLFPMSLRVIAWLALIPTIWTSVRTAARVIRSVDTRILAREIGGT